MANRALIIALMVTIILSMPISILAGYTVTLPLVANGDPDPLYRYAPKKPSHLSW